MPTPRLIAHRGNLEGPDPRRENHPDQIELAISRGYDVEIDVWWLDGRFVLGHDQPEYEVGRPWLALPGLWCHAKHVAALPPLLDLGAHCFFHQGDDVTLTSRGVLWTYPGRPLTPRSVCVMPEAFAAPTASLEDVLGVCSDFVAVPDRMTGSVLAA